MELNRVDLLIERLEREEEELDKEYESENRTYEMTQEINGDYHSVSGDTHHINSLHRITKRMTKIRNQIENLKLDNGLLLKPCPFCDSTELGFSNKRVYSNYRHIRHLAVFCKECNAYGSRIIAKENLELKDRCSEEDIRKAKVAWNIRKNELKLDTNLFL